MTEAERIVEALFENLRGRKLLSWLFADAEEQACGMGAYGYIDGPISIEVQDEIRAAWAAIIRAHLARTERRVEGGGA